ncbi:protein of unknown function DUF134 [Staphylothermus marinus F1]|uniref:DUF134 domain-containing protein n=1 Tax=Staphylothermus marinus (strain ATCC 43588 / DSM 3639 / JCM 9404 / F1) TaxID=399550 RepID=A3DLU3_STAMF|nr:DUF134 domain-containing protein [Staphylothermus marinus]ABN69603.1 protein of unknown function DUF134 [Staphylothermus marinus F1]
MPGRRMGWRVGRPRKPRIVRFDISGKITWVPLVNGLPAQKSPPIILEPDEFEAYRLVYGHGLTQEEAAVKMGISRGTLWRLLVSARRKIGYALENLAPLIIEPKTETP